MKIKRFIKLIMLVAGLSGICYYWYLDFQRFCDRTVPILAYHRVENLDDRYTIQPEIFEKQMAYLQKAGYTTLNLDQYAVARKNKKALHKKIVLIFDDGYEDNLTVAAPIMKKYGFTGSMFMAVKFEGWPGYIDWNKQHELVKYGWEIGSHTYSHVPLPTLSREKVREELVKSKKYVMGIYNPPTGITISLPTGATSPMVQEEIAKAGYIAAVSGKVGVNTENTSLLDLNRVNVFQYKKMQGVEIFRLALLKAQLRSWSLSHGIDVIGVWDRFRGNE